MIGAAALALTIVVLAWGALAFGAPYPWAYWPLAAAAGTAGLLGCVAARRITNRAFALALALVALAVAAQLVTLDETSLRALSPRTPETLDLLDPVYANSSSPEHALSIHPARTKLALALFLAFAMFSVGLASLLSATGAVRLAAAITVLGVTLALIGILQKPLYQGLIYGFWKPEGGWDPFGPFVNKNHFAGWMLLALPVTLGLLALRVETAHRPRRRDLRNRVLWLSSPDAGRLILLAAAAVVMSLATALTFSRSGVLGLLLIVAASAWVYLRHASHGARRAWAVVSLAAIAAAAFAWAGVGDIADRFSDADGLTLGSRRGIWADAARVVEQFPLTGTGINTFGDAMLLYQTDQKDLFHFSAAHNNYLQLLAEGGVLVAAPVLAGMVVLIVTAARRLKEDRGQPFFWIRAGAAIGLVAIGLQEAVDFSLQMPGNAVLFAAVVAIAIHPRTNAVGARPNRARMPVPIPLHQ